MIKDLRDYLVVDLGWAEDVADDIANIYHEHNISGVMDYAMSLNDDEHNYVNEITGDVYSWREI